jgi:hypothetical protein
LRAAASASKLRWRPAGTADGQQLTLRHACRPITVPGYLASDVHFENPDASGENDSPRYATIYPAPLHAYPRAASHTPPAPQIHPQLSQSFRLAGMLVAKDS